MIYYEPKIQEIVELIHSMLRVFSDRKITYTVDDKPTQYDISILILAVKDQLQLTVKVCLSKRELESAINWQSAKFHIASAVILKFMSDCRQVIGSEDIEYYKTFGASSDTPQVIRLVKGGHSD